MWSWGLLGVVGAVELRFAVQDGRDEIGAALAHPPPLPKCPHERAGDGRTHRVATAADEGKARPADARRRGEPGLAADTPTVEDRSYSGGQIRERLSHRIAPKSFRSDHT